MGPPDAENAGVIDSHVLRNTASGPVGGVGGLLKSGQPDHFRNLVRAITGAGDLGGERPSQGQVGLWRGIASANELPFAQKVT